MRRMLKKGAEFGNSWLNTAQIEAVCYIAACKALIDAHEAYPSDKMELPSINYIYTDSTDANMILWHEMFRTPLYDDSDDDIIAGYVDCLRADVCLTPDFINSFYSTDALECFFYRRFADKEGVVSRVMPSVAKASSAITGLALLGICTKHCIDGNLHPVQALSILGMIALPAIIAYKEHAHNPKPDHLRQNYSEQTILESIKCEYRYLKSTPNHSKHILAERLIKEMDKYRPEKRFTDDGFEVYKPKNRRWETPR